MPSFPPGFPAKDGQVLINIAAFMTEMYEAKKANPQNESERNSVLIT